MARRQTAKALVEKFGDAARHSINVGARGERRAVRDHLRRELAAAQASQWQVTIGSGGRMRLADERRFAYRKGREQAIFDMLGWLGGRIERTRKAGGIGRK